MKKRLLTMLAVLVLLVCVLPMAVAADEAENPCANGHDHSVFMHIEKDPTCTETGLARYKCSRCPNQNPYIEIPALGHAPVTDEAVAATCTETGLTEGSHCGREGCGEVLVAQEVTEKIPHDHSVFMNNEKNPTCTETGLARYKCSRCPNQNPNIEIPALGHAPVTDEAVAATCTATGLTEGSHCGREGCGEVLVAQEVTEKIPHDHSVFMHNEKDPTCTETGLARYKCSRCPNQNPNIEIPALGHAPVTDEAVAATCTATGLTEGSHCGREGCGIVLVAQEVTEKIPHDHSVFMHNEKDPTCTETGLARYKCSRCPNQNPNIVIPALGHDPVTDEAVAATCTKPGLSEGSHCGREGCGVVLVEQKVTEKLGHDWGKGKVTKEPTYKAKGEMTYTCKNDPSHTKTEEIAKLKVASTAGLDDVPKTGSIFLEWLYNLIF